MPRQFGKIRKLPSGRFQASYVAPDGARYSCPAGTFSSKLDATAWLAAERRLIELDAWQSPKARHSQAENFTPATPRLDDYFGQIMRERQTRPRKPLKATTADNYRKLSKVFLPRLGAKRLDEIKTADIQKWFYSLPSQTMTRNVHAYQLLSSLFKDAVRDELIERNPCRLRGVGRPENKRQGRALTVDQLTTYLDAVPAKFRLIVALAAWCALRSGEVRGLRRCDVSDDGRTLHICQAVSRISEHGQRVWVFDTPKTAAGIRSVAVPGFLADELAAYLKTWDEKHSNPKRLLWTAESGMSPLADSTLRDNHKIGAQAIGIPDLTLHDLRRTGATLAAQSGATVKELMRRLGHTQPGVAMKYQIADDARDREVAERMSQLK